VIYLALEFGAAQVGLGISLIKAAPHLAGLLRLAAPAMIGRLADRRHFCLGSYLLAALVLLSLPLSVAPNWRLSLGTALGAVVLLWCLYHVLEYLGAVALWSWLADLAPLRIRGRFLGRRERWSVAGQAAAMLAAALFSLIWRERFPGFVWAGYAISGIAGCCFLMASLIPLARMPGLLPSPQRRQAAPLVSVWKPFGDPEFLRYIAFGCWFSFFNGVVQSAQEIFPRQVLNIPLSLRLTLQTGTRVGQLAVSPTLGRWADRVGNRPVLMACLPVIASSMLFFFVASPACWYWIVGAWVAWIAYAGVNVCQPNLMLKLAPADLRPPYVAAYYTASGLCVAASMIVGGVAFDALRDSFGYSPISLLGGALAIDLFQVLFLFGFVTRAMSMLVLLWVREPGGRKG
jgi:MFS family permease